MKVRDIMTTGVEIAAPGARGRRLQRKKTPPGELGKRKSDRRSQIAEVTA